jgi:Family of unknown function (DUF6314)
MGHRSAADLNAVDFLRGRWTVRRSIEDALSGERGTFAGTATFTDEETGLAWVETGTLRWPQYYGAAGRTLRVEPADGSRVGIFFSDGRFFHDLDLGDRRSHVVHDCPPDKYAGIFDRIDADSWRTEWVCDGPDKKLVIRTSYKRLVS